MLAQVRGDRWAEGTPAQVWGDRWADGAGAGGKPAQVWAEVTGVWGVQSLIVHQGPGGTPGL